MFSEELLQEIFSNLHVGQYNLLSHFTLKEKKHVQKGELLLLCLSCILNESFAMKNIQIIFLPAQQCTKYILEIGVPNLIKLT